MTSSNSCNVSLVSNSLDVRIEPITYRSIFIIYCENLTDILALQQFRVHGVGFSLREDHNLREGPIKLDVVRNKTGNTAALCLSPEAQNSEPSIFVNLIWCTLSNSLGAQKATDLERFCVLLALAWNEPHYLRLWKPIMTKIYVILELGRDQILIILCLLSYCRVINHSRKGSTSITVLSTKILDPTFLQDFSRGHLSFSPLDKTRKQC